MNNLLKGYSDKFYISHKVGIVFVVQTVLVIALLFFNGHIVDTLQKSFLDTSKIDIPKITHALEMRTAVFEVQQWLTDVSATADPGGYEDADDWVNVFKTELAALRELEENTTNNKELLEQLDQAEVNFEKFYQRGLHMADVYTHRGRAAGNEVMVLFDGDSEAIGENMENVKNFYVEQQQAFSTDFEKQSNFKKVMSQVAGFVLLSIFGVIIFVLVQTLTKDIIEPIKELILLFARLQENENNVAIDVKGTNEMKELCAAFNECSRTLSNAKEQEDRVRKDLEQTIEVLVGSSSELDDASNGLSETMLKVKSVSDEVSSYINSVSVASEELISSISEISQNTDRAATMTRSAVDEIEATRSIVGSLQQRSEEIAGILKVVSEIANQTNLLALNATIEAARAGEAGKGFAVVANEVKELANRTTESTEDISNKIQAIQKETQGALNAIETATGSVRKINEVAVTIAGAVEEQTAVTTEIGRSMQNSSAKVGEMSQIVTGADTLVLNTKEKSSDLNSVTRKLKELSGVA